MSLAIAATGGFTVLIARGIIKQRTVAELLSLSNAHTRAISTTVDGRRTLARLLANDPSIVQFLKGEKGNQHLRSELLRKTQIARELLNVLILNSQGKVRFSLSTSREGEDLATSPDFLSGRERTTVGTLGLAQGKPQHTIASPIRNERGETLGVLLAEFSLQEIYAELSEATSLGRTGEFLLTEPYATGTVCYSPRQHVFPVSGDHSPISPPPLRLQGTGQSTLLEQRYLLPPQDLPPSLCRLAAVGVEHIILGASVQGETVVAVHRFLPGLGLGVIVKVDEEEMYEPLQLILAILLGTTGILLLLVSFIAFRLSRDVVVPILRLRESLQKLNTGHWQHQRSVFTGDELEILDREVKRLAARLREAYSSLEKRVEDRTQELHQAYAKDKALLESIGEGVLAIDTQGKIITCNHSAEVLLQWKRSQILQSHFRSILLLRSKDGKPLPPMEHFVEKSLREQVMLHNPVKDTTLCERGDGTTFPISFIATPFLLRQEVQGVVVTFRDISEEKQMDRMKSEFISLASHQLRTPLTAIGWYVELLEKEIVQQLTKEQRSYILQIIDSHHRMVELVNALLNVSRIELGTLKIEPEETNILKLLEKMLREFEPQIQAKEVSLTTHLPKRLSATIDPQLLQVVLENLLSNAIKYTPKGGRVECTLLVRDREMEFAVKDTGMGIPKKDQGKIFEKLFRADNVRKADTDGTGIGLYIVKRTVEAWGGHLWFLSEEGKGTTFTFTAPLQMEPQEGQARLSNGNGPPISSQKHSTGDRGGDFSSPLGESSRSGGGHLFDHTHDHSFPS